MTKNEVRRIMKNSVEEAFLEQNADVVFVDVTRTSVGISQIAKNSFDFDKSKDPNTLPVIKKYMVLFYTRENRKDLWAPIWISPDKISRLRKILGERPNRPHPSSE